MRLFLAVFLVSLLLAQAGMPVRAQTQRNPAEQMAYLEQIGRVDEALALRTRLFEALESDPLAVESDRWPALAQFFCYVMAANGITARMYDEMITWEDPSIDIIRAISSDQRPLVEQSLFADLVVLAEVVSMKDVDGPENRRRSDITFRILDRLLGASPGETVVVHQRSSLEEVKQPGSREINPRKRDQYLLLLSRGLYGFGRWRRGETVGEELLNGNEAMVYRFYRYVDDRLVWSGYDDEDTERALNQVRKLAALRAPDGPSE